MAYSSGLSDLKLEISISRWYQRSGRMADALHEYQTKRLVRSPSSTEPSKSIHRAPKIRAYRLLYVLTQKLASGSKAHLRATKLLQDTLNQATVLSPVQRLPTEIVELIFLHMIDLFSQDSLSHPLRIPHDLPWAISQVCAQWRCIALAAPTLWSHLPMISFDSRGRLSNFPKKRTAFLSEMLKRSGTSFLTFRMSLPKNAIEIQPHAKPIIELLLRHSTRWRNISLNVPSDSFFFFKGAKGQVPSLRTLYWSTLEDDWEGLSPRLQTLEIDLFSHAPELRNVSLHHPASIRLLLPPTARVVHCQSRGTTEQLVDVLTCSWASLQSLNVDFVRFPQADGGQRLLKEALFPRLQQLRVGHANPDPERTFQKYILDRLTAPALSELVEASSSLMYPALRSMLYRSRVTSSNPPSTLLTRLCLRTAFEAGKLTKILRLTPLLTHLNVSCPPALDLVGLAKGGKDGWILVPQLQVCALSVNAAFPAEDIKFLFILALTRCELFTLDLDKIELVEPVCDDQEVRKRMGALYVSGPQVTQAMFEMWEETENVKSLRTLHDEVVENLKAETSADVVIKHTIQLLEQPSGILKTLNLIVYTHHKQSALSRPDPFTKLGELAEQILDNWVGLLQLEGSTFPLTWVVHGDWLMFVLRDSELRKSGKLQDPIRMTYGLLRKDIRSSDRLWPIPGQLFEF
ncbi:hypothetical protein GALMADRAFT_153414 [Galerina marginata CBS 339.88]|uniref:F-box domain-containing protein n=1 Tax=Galerina marginata (strain CBS 339.88) TaxID=685588 RepID=A0A067TD33_GALM3|nr:hypothetical protein GALMADRAFT_153414 [Galerina marginata CBS 339.88]